MTSKYQKRLFPKDKLARMVKIVAKTDVNDSEIEYEIGEYYYPELKLVVINNQLCFYSETYDKYFPIARKSTIDKLFENPLTE